VTVVVDEKGQILRTREGFDLTSGGPFLRSLGGRPTIARPSVPFNTFGLNHLELLSGRVISFTQLYRSQPRVAMAVNKLARTIASLPLKVYRLNSQGDRERVREHRLVDLIDKPAPRFSSVNLKQWLAQPVLIHGNSTLLKSRTERNGPPTRLWPLDWRYMQAEVMDSRIEFWKTTEFDNAVTLDPEDVLHLGWEAPDGRIGVSPLQQLGVTVRIERSAQEYQEAYLAQGFRPPSGIKTPEGVVLDKETRAEMRSDIDAVYAGAQGAGRPFLLPSGADWVTVAHNAHEAELIEQRKLSREEIAGVYDIPPPLLGDLDKATFSNITEQHKMLFTTILRPWLTLIEETFQAQIIEPEPAFRGLFVEFDLAEVLRGDKKTEIEALVMAVQAGLMTLNEARRVQNLPKFTGDGLDWCDKPLIPVNNLASRPADPEADPAGNGSGTLNGKQIKELITD
jgi:HK97 family phage portal protein